MNLKPGAAAEELFVELLREGGVIVEPLVDFILRQTQEPRIAPLVDLLGKTMDDRAIPVLMRLLESTEPDIRRAAACGLGWNRARAGLEALDNVEGNDTDPKVRIEARAAIDEILRGFPRLEGILRHHVPMPPQDAATPASHDEVPTDHPDEEQRLKLIASLPRLLALKYTAVPMHFSPGHQLHIAVRQGSERRLIPTMSALTNYHVHLHARPAEVIRNAIDKLYLLGDDDFCAFHDRLTPLARDEVVETVLSSVRPDEPACPLSEVNDAVEAVQVFLSCCGHMKLREASVVFAPPDMTITGVADGNREVTLSAPLLPHRERFMTALRIVAMLDPGAGLSRQDGGRIRCPHGNGGFVARVKSEKTIERDALTLAFERT